MEMRNNRNLDNNIIHPKLFNILSNACKKRDNIRPYFKILIDLMNKNNIYYTVDFGLLLGTVRDNSEILWDDDYDIFMFRQDVSELVQILKKGDEYKVDLTTFKFGIIQNDQGFLNIIAIDTTTRKKIDGITVDLFFEGDKSDWPHPAFNNMFPLRKVKCGDLTVNVMNNPHPHLSNVFGNNYMHIYVICNKEINKYGYSKNHENRYKKISKELYIKLKDMYYMQVDNDNWEINTVSSVSDIGTQTCNSPVITDNDIKDYVMKNGNISIEINDIKMDAKIEKPKLIIDEQTRNKEIIKPMQLKQVQNEEKDDEEKRKKQGEDEEKKEEDEEKKEEDEEKKEEDEEKKEGDEEKKEGDEEKKKDDEEKKDQDEEAGDEEAGDEEAGDEEKKDEEKGDEQQEEKVDEEKGVEVTKESLSENPVSVKISLDKDSIDEEQIVSIDIKSIDDKNELQTKEDLKLELKEELKLELKQELKQELKKKRSEIKNNEKKEEVKTNNIMESFSKNRKTKGINIKNEFEKKGKKFRRNGNKILLN
jgi:phosphorylcholine metabolism protein LicD